MIDSTILTLYLAALTAVYLAPGPDMALIMAASATRGTRAGVTTAAGIGAARFLHVLGSGLGLASLFTTYPALQDMVKLSGAVYLLYLAIKVVRSRETATKTDVPPENSGSDLVRGFLTNLLNPKALLFCGLLLPQFVSPDRGPLMGQFIFLGVILVLYGMFFDIIYALVANGMTQYISKKMSHVGSSIERARRWLMASVFTAIAATLFAG
jgi:threonine/homoserine/homoserine lactone efflux protein